MIMKDEEDYWRLTEECYMGRWLPVLGERTSKDVSHEPAVPHTVLSSVFSLFSPDEDPLVLQYYSSIASLPVLCL